MLSACLTSCSCPPKHTQQHEHTHTLCQYAQCTTAVMQLLRHADILHITLHMRAVCSGARVHNQSFDERTKAGAGRRSGGLCLGRLAKQWGAHIVRPDFARLHAHTHTHTGKRGVLAQDCCGEGVRLWCCVFVCLCSFRATGNSISYLARYRAGWAY